MQGFSECEVERPVMEGLLDFKSPFPFIFPQELFYRVILLDLVSPMLQTGNHHEQFCLGLVARQHVSLL